MNDELDIRDETLDTDVLDDAVDDTLDLGNESDTSLPDNEEHDGEETVDDSDEGSQQPAADEKKDEPDERQKGKMSWLEKRTAEATAKARVANVKIYQTYKKLLGNASTKEEADRELAEDPELYEAVRDGFQSVESKKMPDYYEFYGKARPANQGQNTGQTFPTGAKPESEDEVTKAERTMALIEQKKAVRSIQKKHPDLSFQDVKDEYDFNKRARKWNAIEVLVNDIREDDPDMNYEEAIEEAITKLNYKSAVKQAEKKGQMAGMAVKNGANVGVSKGGSSSKTGKGKADDISDADADVLRVLGINDDEGRDAFKKIKSK